MSTGMKGNLALAFQSSYGTHNVSSLYHIQFLEESVALKKGQLNDQSIGRGVFEEGDAEEGPNTIDGTVRIAAKSLSLGVLLQAALGNASSVKADSAAVYTHTFNPSQTDFDEFSAGKPITILKYTDDAGSASLFYDLNATTLELSASNGEFLTAAISVVGGSFRQIANVSPAFPTGKRFKWDQSSVTIDGTATNKINELTITVENGLEPRHTLCGSVYPSHIKRTAFRTFDISGTMLFDNQTEFQQFLAQTERKLVINFRGGVDISSGYRDELRIEIPSYRLTEFPVNNVLGPIEVSFSASGRYNTGSATAIKIVLVNTQTAYN
jgi:hypothetical protein